MKLLVTGSGGMLARDVMLAAENAGHDVVGYDHVELDVTDAKALEMRFRRERPNVVINCAAWTDVDGAEEAESGASAVNAGGAGNVAAAAALVDAKVAHISTDYVFDGLKESPYIESDVAIPVSVYGQTKLAGEMAVANANKRHFIVRSSGLFGTGGGNFVETMLRLAETQSQVLVVHDQVSSPTYTWHLAYGIVRLIESESFGIHHMAAEGSCSWYSFAQEIFEQADADCMVLSSTTEMLDRSAARPPYSVLESERKYSIRLPAWQDGLSGYLGQRKAEREASEAQA